MANIKFSYMYRNFLDEEKETSIVFRDPRKLGPAYLDRHLKHVQYVSKFFIAESVQVPTCYTYVERTNSLGVYGEPDPVEDHPCHQYLRLESTDEPVNDSAKRRITDFISVLEANKLKAEMLYTEWH